jgi:hypothetical protein
VARMWHAHYAHGRGACLRRKVGVRMYDIDRGTDIHITHCPKGGVEVLIPVVGRPTDRWQDLLREKAKTAQLQVAPCDQTERFWVQVKIPADCNSGQVTKTMDAVKMLISEVNKDEHSPAAVDAEAAIRGWWVHQQ